MSLLDLVGVNLAVTATLMVLLWLVSLWLRDASIVDVFWGPGFVIIAGVTFVLTGAANERKLLLLTLTAIWGLRLAAYLGWRKFGAPEDARYRAMRESIGSRFGLISLVIVFGLQTVIMIIVALPVMVGQLDASPLSGWAILGTGIWSIGFFFECVGDCQLARFKADPANRGKVMDRGLWRYTRHPNYFGDFLVWWGLYFASVGDQPTWWTAIGPMIMSILLLRVSGVTLLERSLQKTKPGYSEYVERTSAFFPCSPRNKL